MPRCILLPFVLICLLLVSSSVRADVIPGIDLLARRQFDLLQGRAVGLITNQTGRNRGGTSTIDLLAAAPGVRLVALFSPEHGIRGDADVKLASSIDVRTGLPVYSLYGASCRPTPAMLAGIDLLVFDIQDIGARFYTYIGTLHHALRAAKERNIPLVVPDRPNPLGGTVVEGAVPDAAAIARRIAADRTGCRSLTVTHPIPTRHGMTVAELARMINREADINADLRIVPMEGWQRTMAWEETGLVWVNPSPNMKDPVAALLYPAFGPLEATSLSVGRGTDRPFHQYGAPWLDTAAVLRTLPVLPGIRFSVVSFTPTAPGHPHRNKLCQGIGVTITDPAVAHLPEAALHLVQAIYRAHPQQFKAADGFHGMVGDREVWRMVTVGGVSPEQAAARWREGIETFRKRREQYLLY